LTDIMSLDELERGALTELVNIGVAVLPRASKRL
jgi:hypothetical protein